MENLDHLITPEMANKVKLAHQGLIAENKLELYKPYDFQREFHNAGDDNPERMLICANGVGKTLSGAAEAAVHATGLYPDWWEGRRFDKPVKIWVGSITNASQRHYTQPALIGDDLGEHLGTGFIPKSRIVGKPRVRAADAPDVVESVTVRHVSGGTSIISFLTYEMGWRKWQGGAPDIIWLDEEPDENDSRQKWVFTECQTRLVRTSGILYITYTPLLGETELTRHFMYPKSKGIWWKGATWDDAPHLKEADKERLRLSYPEHQLEARTKGVPMMGEGRVFSVSENEISCLPFEIPNHFARIAGIDFGVHKEHPTAICWLAWDRDTDVVYLYDCYRVAEQTAAYHTEALKRRGKWIPVAWPHDGLKKDAGSGRVLRDIYLEHGANMLSHSACYDDKKQGAQPQEPIILEILERMKTGRFKVFSTCVEWFEEFRSYHRKEGKLVAHHDDALKASFYATMMLRWACPNVRITRKMNAPRMASTRI